MRPLWVLYIVLASANAIVYKDTDERSDSYSLDRDNEITSESLNTGECMPLKETHDEDYGENIGEAGYKFEDPEEVNINEEPLVKIETKFTGEADSLKHEPITRYPDPYVSNQNASTKYFPPSTSYGVPFSGTYPLSDTKLKSFSNPQKPTQFPKYRNPYPYYKEEMRSKYPKTYSKAVRGIESNYLGNRYETYGNLYGNSDSGNEDLYYGLKSIQYEPYDINIDSKFAFTNLGEDVGSHELITKYSSRPKVVGLLLPNEILLEQSEVNNGLGAMQDFNDGPGKGYFFTMYPKFSPDRKESYLYEVPLKYKSLLFSGNDGKYSKSMQVEQQGSNMFPGLYKSSEFVSPWLQIGSHFILNPEYLRNTDIETDYKSYNKIMYSSRKPEINMNPTFKAYRLIRHKYW